jgi:hypothetical protein
MNDARDHDWNGRALDELLSVVRRNAPRMARHLEAQALLHDPRRVLCALAARRLLPLQAPVMRPLARTDQPVEALAFHLLPTPDRRVLWPGLRGRPRTAAAREHLASALLRLTWNAQAARRASDG